MNKNQKSIVNYLIIIAFSIFLFLFFFEICLRSNPKYIKLDLLRLFPITKVKQELLNSFEKQYKKQILKIRIGNLDFKVNSSSFFYAATREDSELGAGDLMYYNNGFCNRNTNFENPYIIGVGDSFTYCTQLEPEEAWIKNIFNNLDKKKVINIGLNSTGPYEYNELLRGTINEKTKLVLYGFYEGNDLGDILKFKSIPINIDVNEKKLNRSYYREFIKKNLGKFYSLNYIFSLYKKYKHGTFKMFSTDFRYIRKSQNQLFNTTNTDLDEVIHAKLLSSNFNNDYKKINDIFFNSLLETFEEAKKIADNNNSEIIFLYIPSAYSSFGDDVIFLDEKIKPIMNNYSKINQKYFAEVCDKLKLDCINLIKSFIYFNNNSKIPSHFPSNVHLTKEGNKMVSDEIRKYLCKNLFTKSKFIEENCELKKSFMK